VPIYEYRCSAGHTSEDIVASFKVRKLNVVCRFGIEVGDYCGLVSSWVPSRFSGRIDDYDHRAPITETSDMFVGTPLADGMEPCKEYKDRYERKPFIELGELTR